MHHVPYFGVFVALALLAVPIHELGHYWAARDMKWMIEYVFLWGRPKKDRDQLVLHLGTSKKTNTAWYVSIYPFCFGGEVGTRIRMTKLIPKNFIYVVGGGIVVNTAGALILFAASILTRPDWLMSKHGVNVAVCLMSIACLLLIFRRHAIYAIFGVAAILPIVITLVTLLCTPSMFLSLFESTAPAISTPRYKSITGFMKEAELSTTLLGTGVFWVMMIIISIIPERETDGHYIAYTLIKTYLGKGYRKVIDRWYEYIYKFLGYWSGVMIVILVLKKFVL